MSYKNENNGQENKFNKLNTTQNEETYDDNVISTNGAKESAEEESTEQPAHVHIPRKEKKKMKKEAALAEQTEGTGEEEEKEEDIHAANDTEVEGGYEEGEEEEDYEGEEGEYEEGEEEEEEDGKAKGFFETLDNTLHNIDTKKVAKIAAAGFLLVAGARKGGLLGGLALSVATGILAKEIMSSTEEKAQVEEEEYEEEEVPEMSAA